MRMHLTILQSAWTLKQNMYHVHDLPCTCSRACSRIGIQLIMLIANTTGHEKLWRYDVIAWLFPVVYWPARWPSWLSTVEPDAVIDLKNQLWWVFTILLLERIRAPYCRVSFCNTYTDLFIYYCSTTPSIQNYKIRKQEGWFILTRENGSVFWV